MCQHKDLLTFENFRNVLCGFSMNWNNFLTNFMWPGKTDELWRRSPIVLAFAVCFHSAQQKINLSWFFWNTSLDLSSTKSQVTSCVIVAWFSGYEITIFTPELHENTKKCHAIKLKLKTTWKRKSYGNRIFLKKNSTNYKGSNVCIFPCTCICWCYKFIWSGNLKWFLTLIYLVDFFEQSFKRLLTFKNWRNKKSQISDALILDMYGFQG